MEDFDTDDIDDREYGRNQDASSKVFPSTHLDSPLRDSSIRVALNLGVPFPKLFEHESKGILRLIKQCNVKIPKSRESRKMMIDFTRTLHVWLMDVGKVRVPTVLENEWESRFAAVKTSVVSQVRSLSNFIPIDCDLLVERMFDKDPHVWMEELRSLQYFREEISILIIKSAEMQRQGAQDLMAQLVTESGFSLSVNGSGIILRYKGETTIGTRDLLLMIGDLVTERYILLLSTWIAEKLEFPGYLDILELKLLLRWGDRTMVEMGMAGYDVVKEFESTVLGCLLESATDDICDNREFLNSSIDAVENLGGKAKGSMTELLVVLRSIVKRNPVAVGQAFGLYRLWGHPYVNTFEGVIKLRSITQTDKIISQLILDDLKIEHMYSFATKYKIKDGTWPILSAKGLPEHSYLRKVLESNGHLSVGDVDYNSADWLSVVFGKNFDTDITMNVASLIADKSMSLNREELKEQIRSKGKIKTNRVILEWLKSDLSSAREILEKVDEFGFDIKDLIVGLVPKEREMKTTPRMFALLTLFSRMYFVATESLLAKNILPLYDEITMTDTQLQLTMKMCDATKSHSKKTKHSRTVMKNIDFEKWNSNMRKVVTASLFKMFDDLHGFTNVFQRTHDFFIDSDMYVADRTYVPSYDINGDMIEDIGCWKGHQGGIDGLRQKGWTVLTTTILSMVARRHDLRHKILGQGDNQVYVITLPIYSNLDEKLAIDLAKKRYQAFEKDLYEFTLACGLPTKLSETWSSCRMFAFGKTLIFDGSILPMSMKKQCRMFALANDLFPALENSISTIHSNGMSACQSDSSVLISWIISQFEIVFCICLFDKHAPMIGTGLTQAAKKSGFLWSVSVEDKKTKQNPKITRDIYRPQSGRVMTNNRYISATSTSIYRHPELLVSMLMIPKILGGYPVQLLIHYLARGFPDPLNSTLAGLKKLHGVVNDKIWASISNVVNSEMSPFESPTMLVQDPVAVNYLMPSGASGVIKNQATEYLMSPRVVTNKFCLEFFDIAKKDTDWLVETIAGIKPCWPRVFQGIFDATIPGYAKSFIGRIVKTSTIVGAAAKGDHKTIANKLRDSEIRTFNSFLYRSSVGVKRGVWRCSNTESQRLRDSGFPISGPIEGVNVPHAMEYLKPGRVSMTTCDFCDVDTKGYILIKVDEGMFSAIGRRSLKRGPADPYMGSMTHEKMNQEGFQSLVNIEPIMTRAAKMVRIINWMTLDDSLLAELIIKIFYSVTDIPHQRFGVNTGTFSGSAEHRYLDSNSYHGGLCPTQFTMATHLHISTNSLTEYNKGSQNKSIHFQNTMISCQSIKTLFPNQLAKSEVTATHYHLDCTECITDVNEVMLDLKVKPEYGDRLEPQVDNPLLFVRSSRLIERRRFHLASAEVGDISLMNAADRKGWTARTICFEAVSSVMRAITTKDQLGVIACPVVWMIKHDSIELIEQYSLVALAQCIRAVCARKIKARKMESWELVELAIGFMDTHKDLFGKGISQIYLDPISRNNLASCEWSFHLPESMPMTKHSSNSAAADMIATVVRETGKIEFKPDIIMLNSMVPSEALNIQTQIIIHGIQFDILRLPLYAAAAQCIVSSDSDLKISIRQQMMSTLDQLSYQDAWFRANYASIHDIVQNLTEPGKIIRISVTTDILSKRYSTQSTIKFQKADRDVSYRAQKNNFFQVKKPMLSKEMINMEESDLTILTDKLQTGEGEIHLYRPNQMATTAHYKFIDILETYLPRRCSSACVVGDGSGGVSSLVMAVRPGCTVIFNSLVSLEDVVPQSLPNYCPPSLTLDVIMGRVTQESITLSMEGPSDLTKDQTINFLVHRAGQKYDTVICDAEPPAGTERKRILTLYRNVIRVAARAMSSSGVLIIKTYASDNFITANLMLMFESSFSNWVILRSRFSAEDQMEIIVKATGIRESKRFNTVSDRMTGLIGGYAGSGMIASFENEFAARRIKIGEMLNKSKTITAYFDRIYGDHGRKNDLARCLHVSSLRDFFSDHLMESFSKWVQVRFPRSADPKFREKSKGKDHGFPKVNRALLSDFITGMCIMLTWMFDVESVIVNWTRPVIEKGKFSMFLTRGGQWFGVFGFSFLEGNDVYKLPICELFETATQKKKLERLIGLAVSSKHQGSGKFTGIVYQKSASRKDLNLVSYISGTCLVMSLGTYCLPRNEMTEIDLFKST